MLLLHRVDKKPRNYLVLHKIEKPAREALVPLKIEHEAQFRIELPPLPATGDLAIQEVLSSPYFFG